METVISRRTQIRCAKLFSLPQVPIGVPTLNRCMDESGKRSLALTDATMLSPRILTDGKQEEGVP